MSNLFKKYEKPVYNNKLYAEEEFSNQQIIVDKKRDRTYTNEEMISWCWWDS